MPTSEGENTSSSELSNPLESIADQAKQEADDFIDDVKEELIEAKDNFIQEIKDTVWGLGNSIFGDFNLFWSVIKTIFKWFFKPLSLNIRTIETENRKRASEGLKPLYFTDFSLMKSIFMLSITFLVIEEASVNASEDQWINQAVFFLFFVVLLFVFIATMWLWKNIIGIKTKDARVFVGFLIYQYASIYIISFIVNGPLGLSTSAEANTNLMLLIYFIPLLQSLYFLVKLMNYYEVGKLRKVIGFILGGAFLVLFLFLPTVINDLFLNEGISS